VSDFFKLAVYKRVGKIAILVYKRVTKSAAKWKEWWLKRRYQRVPHFCRNDYVTESERLKTRRNVAISGNSIVLARKGCNFALGQGRAPALGIRKGTLLGEAFLFRAASFLVKTAVKRLKNLCWQGNERGTILVKVSTIEGTSPCDWSPVVCTRRK